MAEETQKRFDDAMDALAIKGKAIWSNPIVQRRMGAKDALVKIKDLKCGLPDTFAYYDRKVKRVEGKLAKTSYILGFFLCRLYIYTHFAIFHPLLPPPLPHVCFSYLYIIF